MRRSGSVAAVWVLAGMMGIGCLASVNALAAESAASDSEAKARRTRWWREARFGMFIHWGLYAVTEGEWKGKSGGYGEWIMFDAKIPIKEYEGLAARFNPHQFDADAWVRLAKQAGMRYMVITSKHHDGFAMYDSKVSDYNVVRRTPFARDVVGELAAACRKQGIKFGCYYSIDRDWHEHDAASNEHEQDNRWDFPDVGKKDFRKYLADKAIPQVEELLRKYRPDIMWFDGIGMKTDDEIAQIESMVRRLQPTCLINSRLDTYILPTKWGDYTSMNDNEVPPDYRGGGWENPGTLNHTYAYKKSDTDWKTPTEVIHMLVDIASKGGNYLLNIGPKADGSIQPESVRILQEVGKWIDRYGESIYGTTGSSIGKLPWGRCTARGGKLYLHIFDWPSDDRLRVPGVQGKIQRVYLLADPEQRPLGAGRKGDGSEIVIDIPAIRLPAAALDPSDTVVVMEVE